MGEFKVSLTRTIRDGVYDVRADWLRAAMREYVVCRLWLLHCVCPPTLPDDAAIRAIATTYYSIEETAFKSGFKAVVGVQTYAEHRTSEINAMLQRAKRRWTRLLADTAAERSTLRSYLKALDRIDTEMTAAGAAATADDHPTDQVANGIVAAFRVGGLWYAPMHAPKARTTKQNGLVRYRNAETKRLLQHMRDTW